MGSLWPARALQRRARKSDAEDKGNRRYVRCPSGALKQGQRPAQLCGRSSGVCQALGSSNRA